MYREPIPREEYAFALGQIAYVWGMAAVVGAQIRLSLTEPLPEGETRDDWDFSAELNCLGKATSIITAANKTAKLYNNDTLYGVGIFDLDLEPFVILSPEFGDRYWVTMVTDLYGDVIGNLGTRTTGSTAPTTFLIGPSWHGELPDVDKIVMQSPTRYALVANRVYVAGEEDLAEARRLQSCVDVLPLDRYLNSAYEMRSKPQRALTSADSKVTEDLSFFEALGNVLMDQPPRADEEMAILGLLRDIRITPEKGFAYDELDPMTKVGLRRGVSAAQTVIAEKTRNLDKKVNGWTYNLDTGRAGNDYLLRAALAVEHPFTNIPEEALYLTCAVDAEGNGLTGEHKYVLRFETDGLPPVDAFTSITLYDPDGYLVDNAIDRYSIGDRTPGLKRTADGATEIVVQREQPSDPSNWLPAPEGEFYLYMRCYIPQPPMLNGEWTPPPIVRQT